ncbi:winged helix-turn-helix transcriptional regulator [Xanthomonas campestris]|uniref:winged helix-turn-helix transcriptional regulator n=1 Tax=Xanthomonas campestris TaxID=339 RepID=UPI0023EA1E72|nr:DNA-binding HxlR family transcriptional regulator [Xanthomonas campestris]MCW2038184.1 DNA-binding HxlR family transcriptional regulator [Xanthomonas campestris]
MVDDTDRVCSLGRVEDIRVALDPIANKWSIMILTVLCMGPTRFNDIKRRLGGVTHKSLTDSLRRLQRVGLIKRQVISSSPVAVQYERTELGKTLEGPLLGLLHWCDVHADDIAAAEARYVSNEAVIENTEPVADY